MRFISLKRVIFPHSETSFRDHLVASQTKKREVMATFVHFCRYSNVPFHGVAHFSPPFEPFLAIFPIFGWPRSVLVSLSAVSGLFIGAVKGLFPLFSVRSRQTSTEIRPPRSTCQKTVCQQQTRSRKKRLANEQLFSFFVALSKAFLDWQTVALCARVPRFHSFEDMWRGPRVW